MMSFVIDSRPAAALNWPLGAEEVRPLTDSEIAFIAGGAFAGVNTKAFAFKAGPLAIGVGLGLAIGFGPGSSAGIVVGGFAIG